jgi:hypothetical protein
MEDLVWHPILAAVEIEPGHRPHVGRPIVVIFSLRHPHVYVAKQYTTATAPKTIRADAAITTNTRDQVVRLFVHGAQISFTRRANSAICALKTMARTPATTQMSPIIHPGNIITAGTTSGDDYLPVHISESFEAGIHFAVGLMAPTTSFDQSYRK